MIPDKAFAVLRTAGLPKKIRHFTWRIFEYEKTHDFDLKPFDTDDFNRRPFNAHVEIKVCKLTFWQSLFSRVFVFDGSTEAFQSLSCALHAI